MNMTEARFSELKDRLIESSNLSSREKKFENLNRASEICETIPKG